MQEERLRLLLTRVAKGELSEEAAIEELRNLPFEGIEFATIDHHRHLRQGLPEVIYCPGKSAQQISEIANRLYKNHNLVLATRCSAEQAAELKSISPKANHIADARAMLWGEIPEADRSRGHVAVVTAGTADLPVAKEAALVLSSCAISNSLTADVGVAGLHRVLHVLPSLKEASVCIVIAGMDGVLPSVVGGLLKGPVIACPTSTGYGSSFDGLSALLTMLNSCAAGVTVVNIDNGFGAAVAAFRILSITDKKS